MISRLRSLRSPRPTRVETLGAATHTVGGSPNGASASGSVVLSGLTTAEEATSFRAWLVEAAEEAANAAKEGGFFGIGATLISEREEAMVAQLREVLGVESD